MKNITLWASYDFANSLVQIVFFLYFAQWIVIDQGVPDLYFNLAFTVSAVLLLCSVPFISSLLDTRFRRISGLRYSTGLVVLFYGLCALNAVVGKEIPALIFFTLGLFSYLLTFTFYTPLLSDIADKGKRGTVSGIGIASHYVGQFLGLLFALPFATGVINIFGGNSRAETLLPAVVVFLLCSLPMLVLFREPKKNNLLRSASSQKGLTTKQVLSYPGVGLFLLAYFLFNDAILTASNNFPIFLQQVWGVSDVIKTYIILGIIVTSAIGGLVSGLVADRVGHKKTLLYIMSGWVIILPLLALVNNYTMFVVVTTLLGFWFGSHWAVSRSVMAYLAPEQGRNLAFGYFSLVERLSSFVGPVVWGLVVGNGVAIAGNSEYRTAMLTLTAFIIVGLVALSRVRSDLAK